MIALKIHAVVEEEIFYLTVRVHVGAKLIERAEGHHVAKALIAELDRAESVRQHIKEEESEMLPKAKERDIDFEALGQRIH